MVLMDQLGELDPARVLELCLVHDLGEALGGDVPAPEQGPGGGKDAIERRDLLRISQTLDEAMREKVVALWDEYAQAATPEARAVMALDKIETILQHTQCRNPPDFDYGFNLAYGQAHTRKVPALQRLRERGDARADDGGRRAFRVRGLPELWGWRAATGVCYTLSLAGEMDEWFKSHAWKACIG